MNYRQGDIELIEIKELPKHLKFKFKGNSYILAYGEFTGHQHEFRGDCEILEDEKGISYLVVTKEGKLVHGYKDVTEKKQVGVDRHDTHVLARGIYKIGNEREYDYFSETIQKVLD